jgi:hypothetical protein
MMVTQYVYDGFEGGMTDKPCGDFVSVGDYFALQDRHIDFLIDARRVLDDLSCAANSVSDADTTITDAINNLEAAFMADAHPQDAR